MLYTGIDYHKKYSVASTFDAAGARVKEARIDGNERAAFAAYFRSLPEASAVLMEACWNWGWLYDELRAIRGVASVVLAHPFKTRLIADARGKKANTAITIITRRCVASPGTVPSDKVLARDLKPTRLSRASPPGHCPTARRS